MKISELRNLSKEDLFVKLAATKEELNKLNYLKLVGQVDKPHRFKSLRKTIAQIQTLMNETTPSKKE
jgi:ribosomal protein L29